MSGDMCEATEEKTNIEHHDSQEGTVCITFQIPEGEAKDQQMIERAKDLAWEYEIEQVEVIRQCFRYGIRNYEEALDLEGT